MVYYGLEKKRQTFNRIDSLKVKGKTINTDQHILQECKNYYSSFFKTKNIQSEKN